jgi:hypothetical protein
MKATYGAASGAGTVGVAPGVSGNISGEGLHASMSLLPALDDARSASGSEAEHAQQASQAAAANE